MPSSTDPARPLSNGVRAAPYALSGRDAISRVVQDIWRTVTSAARHWSAG